tara:strand:+ start:5964 stop:7436 length:1473 start_codon:yes stop_codon:yes gene_type:complete
MPEFIDKDELDDDDFNFEEHDMTFEPRENLEEYPYVLTEWINSASQVSTMNEVPCAMAFMCLLGQLMSDTVAVKLRRNTEDVRIHFVWIQTTGSGKSTLFNFLGPVTSAIYEKVNALIGEERYNVVDVKDFTTPALIGSVYEAGKDEEGVSIYEENHGLLRGSGLVAFDEFENVGIFKAHNHKEGLIGHLNTMLNTLWGENWRITKKLTNGPILVCEAKRSIYATTYPPKNLQEVITDTGLLQRMVMYVRETTDYEKDQMMMQLIEAVGIDDDIDQPIEKFANALFKIYTTAMEHKLEIKAENPDWDKKQIARNFVVWRPEVQDYMKLEYYRMQQYLRNVRDEVKETTDKFSARMFINMNKMAILMSIMEAPSIKDKSKRYVVSVKNVRQASRLMRQSYIALVAWLDVALRERRESVVQNAGINHWKTAIDNVQKTEDGFALKADLMHEFMSVTRTSRPTAFRKFKSIKDYFIEEKRGKPVYVKWKGDEQ